MDVKTKRPASSLQISANFFGSTVEYDRPGKKTKSVSKDGLSAPTNALPPAFSLKGKTDPSFLKKLLWLNSEQATIAKERYNSACLTNTPYVFSSQVIGGDTRFMDGASAGDFLSAFEGESEEKSENGIAWSVSESKSRFHCFLPDEGRILEFGTQKDLLALGMSTLDAMRIFRVNVSDSDPYFDKEEVQRSLKQSRVLYSMLFRAGVLLPKDENKANEMISVYSKEETDKTVIDLMVGSAISTCFFVLKTGIQLGFDPNAHSEKQGTNAISAAIVYGKKQAVDFLLGYSGPQHVDYEFINSSETFLTKENEPLITWAKGLKR